jgi:hypothetical protein
MFHIDRSFRAQGRYVGAANVCMQRGERLSENGFVRRAGHRCTKLPFHGAELNAPRCGTGNRIHSEEMAIVALAACYLPTREAGSIR